MRIRSLYFFTVIAGCWPLPAVACGPHFPNSYLLSGNEGHVLVMPQLDFYHEFQRNTPTHATPPEGGVRWERTMAAEASDLRTALAEIQTPTGQIDATVERYIEMRRGIKRHYDGHEMDTNFYGNSRTRDVAFGLGMNESLLDSVPSEFMQYARGAAAYRANDLDHAIYYWNALFELPETARRYRSAWAAFMLGKVWLKIDATWAIAYFEETRALVGKGFQDSLGLAKRSWGWQSMAESSLGRHPQAMRSHVRQYQETADYDVIRSLNALCKRVMNREDIPTSLVRDPVSRRILTSWVLSKGSRWNQYEGQMYAERWLDACEKAESPLDPEETDHMAWVAYKAGRFEKARELLDRSEQHCPAGNWVLAKLLLRDGKIDEGIEVLRGIVAHFPVDGLDDVRAHIGVLQLGRREYVKALDVLARSGYWTDTAYVAERVLTLQELEEYLNRHQDDETLAQCRYRISRFGDTKSVLKSLKYLVARRLARNERWEEAERCYPPDLKEPFRRYWHNLAKSRDESTPKRERAASLYIAARLTRDMGMELLGSELYPDFHVYAGSYNPPGAYSKRLAGNSRTLPDGPDRLLAALKASEDEKQKANLHLPVYSARFHYRLIAADRMWECAQLSPDNDPLTAAALYYGGLYLKDRYPKKADRFYKALVRRCSKLPFGQEADRRRWFPKDPPPDPV